MEFRQDHHDGPEARLAGAVVRCCPHVASKDLAFQEGTYAKFMQDTLENSGQNKGHQSTCSLQRGS
jgi:hypothetical protein